MPTPILMPALSPTMEEGNLTRWLVKEGDAVDAGKIIAEIETDKATMEVEAVDEGKIGKILVAAGTEGVKVNTPIAVLLEDGESADSIDLDSLVSGSAPAKALQANRPSTPAQNQPTQANGLEKSQSSSDTLRQSGADRVKASPLAKRLAAERGIDLTHLSGSGPHGRIVKRDLANISSNRSAAGVGAGTAAPYEGPINAAELDPRLYPPDSYVAIKNDGMRKTIAKRLWQSFNSEVPHFPLEIECKLDALLLARKQLNSLSPKPGEEDAFKISVNDFIIKASAMALMKVPAANASYTEAAIIRHKHADIGVAVAIEGGLITPIIWQAEIKGLKEISSEVKDMAARAKEKKLKPQEYQGGTFSVSNLGMFGIKSFASIINQPQGAIMSVGAGEPRVIVEEGEMKIATMMSVTLTCDHRVVDGATGALFLQAFKNFIEEPAAMLL